MKKLLSILVLGALIACLVPANAQNFTPQRDPSIQSQKIMTTGAAYNGTVYEPFSSSTPSTYSAPKAHGGVRRSGSGDSYPGWHYDEETKQWVPDNAEEYGSGAEFGQSSQSPIGDAVLPLMLMSLAFCVVIYFRRRKAMKQ